MTASLAAQYWLDGEKLSTASIAIDTESPLLQAGEAWFETLRIVSGVPMLYAAHLQRLCHAVAACGVADDLVRESLHRALQPALDCAREWSCGRLRITVLPRPCITEAPQVLVALSAYTPSHEAYQEGIQAMTTSLSHPRLGSLGKSLSYHWSQVARREAYAGGADEALFACAEGWLEASTASLLWRDAEGWCSTSGCNGTLTSVTVQALRDAGVAIGVREVALRPDVFAQGLLLVSALRLVVAVRAIDGQALPTQTAAAATLRELLLARVA